MKLYKFTEWIARPIIQLNKEKRIEINIKEDLFYVYEEISLCLHERRYQQSRIFP